MQNDPVQKQFVNLNLTGGVNKKQDAHQLSNGQLLTADNVIFGATEGQVTKRAGYVAITPQGAPFTGGPFTSIGVRDNIEPLILGTNTLNRYNVERDMSTSIPMPTQGRLDVTQVVGSTGQSKDPWPPSDASVATDGANYACLVWQEPNITGSFCYYGVQDVASGTWIIPPTIINPVANGLASGYTFQAMHSPVVRYFNNKFYIFYIWTGSNGGTANPQYASFIYYVTFPSNALSVPISGGTSNFAISGTNSVNSTICPSPYGYDVHIANGKFILASGPSNTDTSKFDVNFGTIAADGNLQTANRQTFTSNASFQSQRCAVKADGPAANPFLLATANTLTAFTSSYAPMNTSLPNTVTASQAQKFPVDCAWNAFDALWVGQSTLSTTTITLLARANFTTNTLNVQSYRPPVDTNYQQLLSRLFFSQDAKTVYAWVGAAGPSSDSVYNSAFLCEFNLLRGVARTVCRTLYLQNAHITNTDMMVPCDVIQVPNTQKYVTFLSSALEKSARDYHAFGALNRIQYDFRPVRSTQLIPLPQGGVLGAGSYPFYYDGNVVAEAGFSSTPTADAMLQTQVQNVASKLPLVLSAQNGLTGGTSAVTASGFIEYYYVICFVRRDAYGNVYRSAPSPVITVPTPNALNNVIFPVYTYNGGGNIMIEYYRSTQNIRGTYYFIGQTPNSSSFTDVFNDGSTTPSNNTSITRNRTVYTNANELPNDPPPAIHHAAVSETRVYIIPSDARNTIWFSKLFSPGRTVEFSANNVLTTGNNSGLFTAIHVLDGNVIVFKEDQIFYFYGNGPDNTGSGTFSTFLRITTDVGCIDPASVITIPEGILFRSRRGIEMLNRSLQVVYVGAPIEPLLKSISQFSSAVLVPRYRQVRFISAQANQPVLVYDYGAGRWSTFSNMSSVNARTINGVCWWISQDGTQVNRETPDDFTDNGAPIIMTLETPEIPVGAGGLQGWGRAYRMALLGDFFNTHQLTVQFAYDHSLFYTDAVVFNTTSGLITGDQVYQFRCSRLPRQVMQTLKLKITDIGTTGQSCAISNIAFEVGSKNGLAKLAAQKTV